jgi:hypothetical protein
MLPRQIIWQCDYTLAAVSVLGLRSLGREQAHLKPSNLRRSRALHEPSDGDGPRACPLGFCDQLAGDDLAVRDQDLGEQRHRLKPAHVVTPISISRSRSQSSLSGKRGRREHRIAQRRSCPNAGERKIGALGLR